MSCIAKASWMTISDNAYRQLNQTERARASRYVKAEDIKNFVKALQANSRVSSIDHLSPRLSSITQLASQLHDDVFKLSESQNEVCTMVWITLGLGIESTARETEFLELITGMYEELLKTLPKLTSFKSLDFALLPNLSYAIYGIYQEHLGLGLRTIETFGRAGEKIGILSRLRWKRGQNAFHRAMQKLVKLNQLAIQEVGAFNVEEESRWRGAMRAAIQGGEPPPINIAVGMRSTPLSVQVLRFPIFLVPLRSGIFTGRKKEMELLKISFDLNNTQASEKRRRIIVVHGLGGVGKTKLAIEFAHVYRSMFDLCFHISVETPVKLAKGFDNIAQKLQISEASHTQTRTRVKDWLCETDKSWLLILDNAEEPPDCIDYLPESTRGCILVTTRSRSWLHQDFVDEPIFLESFAEDDGVAMFKTILQRHNRTVHPSTALAIVQEIGSLPLAIRQIACYVATTHADPQEFLQRYRESEGEAQRVDQYLVEQDPQAQCLATVWDLTLAKLPLASIFLLNVMILLDPDSIPVNLFTDGITNGTLAPYIRTTEDYDEGMNVLQRYSLVTMSSSPKNGDPVLNIHRQVRRNVLNKLDSPKFQEAFEWLLNKIRKEFPHQSPFAEPLSRQWKQCGEWIFHLTSMNAIVKTHKSKLLVPGIFLKMLVDGSIYLWERGLLKEGHFMISSARHLCEDGDPDRTLLAEIYSFQGCILSDQGETRQAKDSFSREVQLQKEHFQDLHRHQVKPSMTEEIKLANAYNNLAGINCALAEFSEAFLHNQLSLSIKERWKDKTDLEYLLSLTYNNLGNVCGLQNRWDDAETWYTKALAIPEEKHYAPRLALIYHNFGCMRITQGLFTKATTLLTEAVQLRTENLGDHYDTANSLHLLALCYQRTGGSEDARDLLKEALRILEGQDLRDKRRIARTKFMQSNVLQKLSDPSAAVLRREALESRAEILGKPPTGQETEEDFDDLVPYI